jgi:transposase
MDAKVQLYVPRCFNSFQGFSVKDIKEFATDRRMEIHLERDSHTPAICNACGSSLGHYHDQYLMKVKHLRVFDWSVEVHFMRNKYKCTHCNKIRSEWIPWLCPTTPNLTMDFAWWLNRLTEITSVKQVSNLYSVDKMTCYKIDRHILQRLFQGYKIPDITHIGVDEVYARSPLQKEDGETRDDLFFTVIVDLRTHKVIWVSKSRRKEALDTFFMMIGKEACEQIKVVATDQHEGYGKSVRENCPNASLVWDRFHLLQRFNDVLNDERKKEAERVKGREHYRDLLNGKNRFIFLKRAIHRSTKEKEHLEEVVEINWKISRLELIKEKFHQMYDSKTLNEAELCLLEAYEWAANIDAWDLVYFFEQIRDSQSFWNYFHHRYTTSVVEGINRAIKGLKWQAYGYKDMAYFALKILQKLGYLNHKYALQWLYQNEATT